MMIIIIIVGRRDDFIILYRRRASRISLRRTTYLYIIYTHYRYLPTYLVPTSIYHYLYTFCASRPAVSRSVVQVYSRRSERLTRRNSWRSQYKYYYDNRYCFSLIFYTRLRVRTFVRDVGVVLRLNTHRGPSNKHHCWIFGRDIWPSSPAYKG